MQEYIALKPVKFDRNYSIGEKIPNGTISPKVVKRLLEQGRIAKIDGGQADVDCEKCEHLTEVIQALGTSVESMESDLGIEHNADLSLHKRLKACFAIVGQQDGVQTDPDANDATGNEGQFDCTECERTFTTSAGLANHMRVHRQGE